MIVEDNVREVFATASYFGMTAISQQCVDFITSQLSPHNIMHYIVFCQKCEYELSERIMDMCEQYLCEHAFRDRTMHAKFSELQLPILLKVLKSDDLWIPSEYQRYCFAKEILVKKMSEGDDHSVADSAAEFSDASAEPSAPSLSYMCDDKDSEMYPIVQFPPSIYDQHQTPSISVNGDMFDRAMKDFDFAGGTKDSNSVGSVEMAVLDVLKSGISYAHIHHDVVLDILKDVTLLKNKDVSDAFRKGMCQGRLLQLLTERTGNGLHVFAGLTMGDDFPPPFRFSVEFKNAAQITDRMPGYSEKHFYGGSFWWLSCVRQYQDRTSLNDGHYGVYLHRDSTVKFPRPPYRDPRDKILIDYSFRCRDISQGARTEILKNTGYPEVLPCNRLHEYTIDGSLFLTLSLQLVFQ